MRTLLRAKVTVASLAVFSIAAYAQNETSENFRLEGSHQVTIPTEPATYDSNSNSFDYESLAGVKTIQLMTIVPTQQMIDRNIKAVEKMIAAGGEKDYSKGIIPFNKSAGAIDLGMENVPVLDQGAYGTCVTFAATAALDAKLKKGDYIDQQCSLALNKSLGNNYWNGAYNAGEILDPLKKYGIISKGNCFGKKYATPSQSVTATTYQTKSDKSYSGQINYTYIERADLNIVKTAIKAGHRVAIGTSLADTGDSISVAGFDMNINGVKTKGGLWACKQPSNTNNYCADQNAGHEVIIIGFDDKQELLKIRNSWNTRVGDQGNFYMTYSFFNAMVIDHTEVK